jgi:hypothetical protein
LDEEGCATRLPDFIWERARRTPSPTPGHAGPPPCGSGSSLVQRHNDIIGSQSKEPVKLAPPRTYSILKALRTKTTPHIDFFDRFPQVALSCLSFIYPPLCLLTATAPCCTNTYQTILLTPRSVEVPSGYLVWGVTTGIYCHRRPLTYLAYVLSLPDFVSRYQLHTTALQLNEQRPHRNCFLSPSSSHWPLLLLTWGYIRASESYLRLHLRTEYDCLLVSGDESNHLLQT